MIISIASGKGGTGKTLVATSLALSLKENFKVRLLDCDVEEPNDHLFMNPVIDHQEAVPLPVPVINMEKCDFCGKCAAVCAYKALAVWGKQIMTFPQLCHGCGACSYVCPQKAICEQPRAIGVIESGHSEGIDFIQGRLNVGEAMSPPVIRKVRNCAVSDVDVTIIDSPPGTSCPVVTAVRNSDFCILVTEPTPFGLNDLKLAVETVKELNVPCGVILNRYIGGEGKVEQYCLEENIPVLLTIPLDIEVARLYSRGIIPVKGFPEWKRNFVSLFETIQEIINERSSCAER
jgi:MinD superfamily P-loop ATPase